MVKKTFGVAICILFVIMCGLATQVKSVAGPGEIQTSGTPSCATMDAPANDSVLYAYSPISFYKNVSGYVNSVWLQVQYPNAVIREFPASTAFAGGWTNLSSVLSINNTGDFGYRFVNASFSTPWTTFSVIDNVELISIAPVATNWLFIDPLVTSWDVLYNASFPYEHWTFSQYGWVNVPYATIAGDTYAASWGDPDQNHGSEESLYLDSATGYGYLQMPSAPYLTDNGTTQLAIYSIQSYDYWANPADINVAVDAVDQFYEGVVTWNNQPDVLVHLTDYLNTYALEGIFVYPTFSSNYTHVRLSIPDPNYYILYISKDSSNAYYFPRAAYTLGLTAQDDYHVMMQSNTSDTPIYMRSPAFSAVNLVPDDKISISFSTTSHRQVFLNLKHSGSVVKSIALTESPNYDYSEQTKTFVVTSSITIDQVEISGTFDDTEHFQTTNVTIARPTTYTEFDLAPFWKEEGYLAPSTYELSIFESGSGNLVLFQSATVVAGIVNKFIYSPTTGGQRVITFFDSAGNILDFYQFRCKVTRTYNNLTVTYNLSSPYFYADDGSRFYLNVTDRFGNAILSNYNDIVDTFNDITLSNIYNLKIKNEMRLPTLLQLTRNNITQSEYAMSDEIVEYTLWNGTYQLNYTQAELNKNISINLAVTSASIYNISTAYHVAYITVWSLAGDARAFTRLYVNGTRREYGPIEVLGETNVTVLDYTNVMQYSRVLNLGNTVELDIFVYLAHLGIQNLDRNQSAQISVSKGGLLLMSQQIGYGGYTDWYATNGTYDLTFTWANGTVETQVIVVSSTETELGTFSLDFGHYEQELPPIADSPDGGTDDSAAWWTLSNVVGTIALIVGVILIIFAGIQTRKFRRAARILNTVNGM